MTNKKKVPLAQVLSITSGKLLCDLSELYGILNFLTNDRLCTHQLRRTADEVTPYIFNDYPALKDYDLSDVTKENWKEKLQDAEAIFGRFLELEPIPVDDHSRKDPMEELSEMVDPGKIIHIDLDDDREEWEKD